MRMAVNPAVRNTVLAWALICTSIIVARAETPVDEPKSGRRFLTVAEMLKTMAESRTEYRFGTLEDLKDVKPEEFANVYWPPGKAVDNPWIEIGDDKSRTLKSFPLEEETRALLDKGETHFKKKKYDKAAKYYRRAIERSPRCYLAYLYLGDCHFHKDENARAVEL